MNTTYELVHRFLLMGNTPSQASPSSTPAAPPASIPAALRAGDRADRSQRPASTPSSTVATAGRVLGSPSGSQVPDDFHRCAVPSTARSTYAARLESGARLPAPYPGTGTRFIAAQ